MTEIVDFWMKVSYETAEVKIEDNYYCYNRSHADKFSMCQTCSVSQAIITESEELLF